MSDPSRLDDRIVVVTGASSGIGRATAKLLSDRGARIALVGRDRARLDESRGQLNGDGHEVFQLDLDDADRVPQFMREISDAMGRLYGLAHCAGVHQTLPVRSVHAANVDSILHSNVTTSFMLAKGFRHKMVRAEDANMIFMSSAVGIVGQAGVSSYAASKGAIVSMTKSLALELAPEGIRVNCVCPGVVVTPMTQTLRDKVGEVAFANIKDAHPLGLGTAEDVAAAVRFLLSAEAKWITGTALSVDGGFTAK